MDVPPVYVYALNLMQCHFQSLITVLLLIMCIYHVLTNALSTHIIDINLNTIFCWAIQVGLLTPLTFAWHRLSPLGAFTSGAYFLHSGRW